jgi:phage gpG-like protein
MAVSDQTFSITYHDVEVRSLLSQLQAQVQNLRPAMLDIGEAALLITDQGFEREQDPNGIAWKPLSAKTLEWKTENSRILKILQSTGRLRASITYQASDDRVVIGTNAKYARKLMRDRIFLGVGTALRTETLNILQDHIEEALL